MRKRVLAGIAAVAAGILIGMPVCAQEEPISDGVFIGDKNVGGMMPDEAAQYVKNEVATLGSTTVTITMGGQQTSATFRELGFSWENTDLVDEISQWFARVGEENVFLIYTLLVWFSVLFSAFIDNIPYVATMLPVASGIAQIMGVDAFLLYFGIMVGATLGGNLTPIGASANITGIGLLRKEGYTVRTVDFLRIGVPSTLTAVVIGYVLIWLIYG